MSQVPAYVHDLQDDEMVDSRGHVVSKPMLGSLEARVAARRNKIEKRTVETFNVPGFEDLFKVDLRHIGAKQQYAIAQRHEHADEYQMGLRASADLIVVATVGFHAVDADGNSQEAEGASWKGFAKVFDKTLSDATLEKRGGGRVALVRLLGEDGVIELATAYKKWTRSRGVEVERELEDL